MIAISDERHRPQEEQVAVELKREVQGLFRLAPQHKADHERSARPVTAHQRISQSAEQHEDDQIFPLARAEVADRDERRDRTEQQSSVDESEERDPPAQDQQYCYGDQDCR